MPKHQRFTMYFDLTKFPGNFPGKVLVVPGIPVSREIKIQREIAGSNGLQTQMCQLL